MLNDNLFSLPDDISEPLPFLTPCTHHFFTARHGRLGRAPRQKSPIFFRESWRCVTQGLSLHRAGHALHGTGSRTSLFTWTSKPGYTGKLPLTQNSACAGDTQFVNHSCISIWSPKDFLCFLIQRIIKCYSRTCLAWKMLIEANRRRYTGQQSGTKSGRRPADQPLINRLLCSSIGLHTLCLVRIPE